MSLSQSSYEIVPMPEVEAKTGPSPPALRDPPSGDWWDETQWGVFISLLEAVLAPVVAASDVADKRTQKKISDAEYERAYARIAKSTADAPDRDLFRAFLRERPTENPAFLHCVRRTLSNVPAVERKKLGDAFTTLSKRTGAFLLTGYCTPVQEQPVHVREAIVQAWTRAWLLPSLRVLAKSLTMLAQSAWGQTSPLLKQISGYSDVPRDWEPVPHLGCSFLQFGESPDPAVVETDVVIVGSGCGGAVCAKVLAEGGHGVVVVDKGYFFPAAQLPMPQEAAYQHLFENEGVISSADSSVSVIAGSCWGGGGAVNWSVSLQTQGFVRREWARKHGLPFFESQAFQDRLDRVCAVMGATTDGLRQSHRGQALLDGCRRLGYHAEPVPQISAGQDHPCGHCHLGCGSRRKRGTNVTWLPAAAEAGARFIEGMQAELTFDDGPGKRASGIRGTWVARDGDGGVSGPLDQRRTREVVVKAKKVIVSCGSLWSPLVLMKGGIKNRHLGQNLHIHPVNFVTGYYPEDTRPWEGGIITSCSNAFENLDNDGHGVKLETNCMLPGTAFPTIDWRSSLDFKLSALRYRHMAGFIALARDRDTGSVSADPRTGRPVISYTPSAHDRAHLLEGVIALAKICYITGATEIRAELPGAEVFVRDGAPTSRGDGDEMGEENKEGKEEVEGKKASDSAGVTDPAFTAWLDAIRRAGNPAPTTKVASAHQMGTCRMSSHEGDGVVDPRGRVWGTRDLYVADASVFPSASGVNPMVTNMAIADWIAWGVCKDLAESRAA